MASLQLVPAGSKQIAPGVWTSPRRRGHGGGRHHAKGKKKGGKHSFWSKQWVWFAIALVIGEILEATVFSAAPAFLSIPGLVLIAYGQSKKKPGAVNAGLALQGQKLASYFGITGMAKGMASKFIKTDFQLSPGESGGGGGGGGGGFGGSSQDTANAIALLTQLNQMAAG